MIDIGTLVGRITLEDDATVALKKFSVNAETIGGALSSAGRALTLGITAPLIGAAAASLSFSSTFEASMTRLVSLAGVSQEELAGVKQHILDLAPAVGIGPQALADAMTKVSSTVADTKVALEILDIAAKGSAAGLGEAVDVAGALTAVINSYGASNITAARAADILTKTIQDGGAEAKELAPVLANVVPIAAQMGIKFEEVGANIATLTKLGVPASEAVTQLTSVMSALLKEAPKGAEALATVGMNFADLRQEVKDKGLAAALTHLTEVFKGNETGLTHVFGRIEALRNIMGTAGQQAETYALEVDRITKSAGSAQGAFDAMANTQTKTWGQFTASLQVVAIQLGDALAPAFGSVLKAVIPLVEKLGDLVKWFTSLPQWVQNSSIAFLGIAAALGPVLLLVGGIASGVAALTPLVPLLGAAFAAATGPIGLVALAIGGLVAAVVAFRGHMADLERQSSNGKVISGLKDEAGNVIVSIDQVNDKMKALGQTTSGDLQNGFSLTIDKFKKVGEAAKTHTTLTLEQIKAQEEYTKELAAVNAKIAAASKDIGTLSTANKVAALSYDAMGLSAHEVGIKLHVSELAVKAYLKELDDQIAGMKENEQETVKFQRSFDNLIVGYDRGGKLVLGFAGILKTNLVGGLVAATQSTVTATERFKLMQDQADRLAVGMKAVAMNIMMMPDVRPGMSKEINDAVNSTDKFETSLDALSKSFGTLAQVSGDTFGGINRGMGQFIALMSMMQNGGALNAAFGSSTQIFAPGHMLGAPTSKGGQAAFAAAQMGAGYLADATENPESKAGQVAHYAAKGAQYGSVIPVLGTGVGAGIGAIVGALKVSPVELAARKSYEDFQTRLITQFNATATAQMKAEASGQNWKKAIIGVREAYIAQGHTAAEALADIARAQETADGNTQASAAALAKITSIVDKQTAEVDILNSAVEQYGLTWRDLSKNAQVAHLTEEMANLVTQHDLLAKAGYNEETIIKRMSGAMNQYLIDAINTGSGIPPAMQPMLEQMIRMGLITHDAAAAMLGLKDESLPSYAELKNAADKYGISMSALGPKVKQININEQAAEVIANWKTLTSVSDNYGAIIAGIGPKIKDWVKDALQAGMTIPEGMKPILQAMLDSGQLVDENGDKLRDLSRFNFAKPIEEMIESLISKLDELVEAFKRVGQVHVSPQIDPVHVDEPRDQSNGFDPSANSAYTTQRADVSVTSRVYLDGREIAYAMATEFPEALDNLGIGAQQP